MSKITLNAANTRDLAETFDVIEMLEILNESLPTLSERYLKKYLSGAYDYLSESEKNMKRRVSCVIALDKYFRNVGGVDDFIEAISRLNNDSKPQDIQKRITELFVIDKYEFENDEYLSCIDLQEMLDLGFLTEMKSIFLSSKQVEKMNLLLDFYQVNRGAITPGTHPIEIVELVQLFKTV